MPETDMSLTRSVDMYCERTSASFWSEPFNAISNVGFFVAAWLLWRALERVRSAPPTLPAPIRALAPLLASIGVFSFMFHTLATRWAAIADQLSILMFGCVFFYAFLRHCAELSSAFAFASAVLFSLASYSTGRLLPAGFLNETGGYLPYLAGLLAMTGWLASRGATAWRGFAIATGLFCCALALRTVDQAVCAQFPIGTHFLWHLVNAGVLLLLTLTLARAAAARVDGPRTRL
jgi:hypothetical protein